MKIPLVFDNQINLIPNDVLEVDHLSRNTIREIRRSATPSKDYNIQLISYYEL